MGTWAHLLYPRVLVYTSVTNGRTDQRTNGRTDGRTHPLIEMRGASKNDKGKIKLWRRLIKVILSNYGPNLSDLAGVSERLKNPFELVRQIKSENAPIPARTD